MTDKQTLARKILRCRPTHSTLLESVVSCSYHDDRDFFVEKFRLLFWTLSARERLYYGKIDWNTVEQGLMYLDRGLPIAAAFLHRDNTGGSPTPLYMSALTHPNYRGQGYGLELSKTIRGFCGEQEVSWFADQKNVASLSLAKKSGFKQIEYDNGCGRDVVYMVYKPSRVNESANTKDNMRSRDKSDGVLYSGPAELLIEKVKVYDSSGDIVLSGRVGNAPEQFRGAKFLSTNIENTPMALKYYKQFALHPNGLALKVNHAEFKKQDGYNYLRITIN